MAILRRIFRSPHVSLRSLNSATSLNKSMSPRPRLILAPAVESECEAEVVGCSHGWVAVFNKRNNNLFLSDPLSDRNIELPPIHTLPDPEFNLDLEGQGSVSKVILSSSADDDDCRAMMTFGPANRLAFCLPGRSSEWTPIGDHFFDFDRDCLVKNIAKVHEDLVYCATRKVFTCITTAHLNLRNELYYEDIYPDFFIGYYPERFDWDIQDPHSPKLVRSETLGLQGDQNENVRRWVDANMEVLENECIQIPHLAYLEERDQLFMAMQFVRLMKEDSISPLGFVPRCEVKGLNGVFPGKTFGFVVMNMDDGQVMGDLSGMTLFLGINHSFAFVIEEEDQFNPNSIYFADSKRLKRVCGLHDYGIFDYGTKTISSAVVCDCDDHHVSPTNTSSSPFWLV